MMVSIEDATGDDRTKVMDDHHEEERKASDRKHGLTNATKNGGLILLDLLLLNNDDRLGLTLENFCLRITTSHGCFL